MLSARETFHAGVRTIVAGELLEPDDDVVAGNEHLFSTGVESDAGTSAALEALQAEAEAAAKANADLQAALAAMTAERDALAAAATKTTKTAAKAGS
jgi:hypothetical protein